MNIYLQNIPLEDALAKYIPHLSPADSHETIHVTTALGRFTAQAIFAAHNSPLYDSAAMDGIAVISHATTGAREISPITLHPGEYTPVDTGDPVPPPYNAVIMIEEVERGKNGEVIIRKAATEYQHIRAIGEDIVSGEMILPTGHKIRGVDIGSLLSGGITHIDVQRFSIGIIPTGTELLEPGAAPETGGIFESNSFMLAALAAEEGCQSRRYDIVPDEIEPLRAALKQALAENDMVLVCSGTSAGREDFTRGIIEEMGEIFVHGVAIKPGKPAILAKVQDKAIIGVPGYPVSAYIVWREIVLKVVTILAGETTPPYGHPSKGGEWGSPNSPPLEGCPKGGVVPTPPFYATLTRRLVSSAKHKEFIRVKLGKVNDTFVATPLPRGAGASMSLVRADGFCIIDQQTEGIEAGTAVQIALLRNVTDIENTILSIGSHDILMDILADKIRGYSLSSAHVGTMGGLMALKNGECHIAPIHHLCETDGTYNTAIVRQLFPNQKMAIIKVVQRVQGLMVANGNPLNIMGIPDLARVRYVNRSRGTGTRQFLDYNMKEHNISPTEINGYTREVATHMNVGGIVASGGADAGMGVLSAANACGLDFVPIGVEEYDFAIHAHDLELPGIQALLQVLRSQEFAAEIECLGGYELINCGTVNFSQPRS